jgi:glycosyltransferase involved in cell wall biosynthesis
MAKPLVSAIITTYNREDTISRAISSVLRQTFQDFEIVIVDDASTDQTVKVIQDEFKDKRIRIIENAHNLGIGGAKNVGVENAKGTYIAFLDSDDEWMAEKLERQLAFMQSDENKLPLSFTGLYVHRETVNKVVMRQPRKQRTWFETILYGEKFSLGSTLVATKECFEKVGPFEVRLKRMQDRDWSIRYFDYYHAFSFLPEPLARIHNSGWPEAGTVEFSIKELFKENEERLKKRGMYYVTLFDVSLCFEAAVAHFRSGKKRTAIRELAKCFKKKPSFLLYVLYRFFRKIRQADLS